MITANDTARILIEALPYIRRFTGKTIVVKVGGLPMTDPERMRSLGTDPHAMLGSGRRKRIVRVVAGRHERVARRKLQVPRSRERNARSDQQLSLPIAVGRQPGMGVEHEAEPRRKCVVAAIDDPHRMTRRLGALNGLSPERGDGRDRAGDQRGGAMEAFHVVS